MLILAMPGIVLATGFFLLLNNTIGLPQSADGIVIFTNALMAIPTPGKCWKTRCVITARYSMLCQSLGIEGWSRLKAGAARLETSTGAGAGLWPACCRLVILAW